MEIPNHIIAEMEKQALELRRVQELIKVPLTSFATALDISNTIGVAAVHFETIAWAYEKEQAKREEETAQRRSQGAKDGWEIRRARREGK